VRFADALVGGLPSPPDDATVVVARHGLRTSRPAAGVWLTANAVRTRVGAMADNSLQQRVFAIEQMLQDYATGRDVERVERTLSEQIVQLRDEMRSEFSAVREEIRAGDEASRGLVEQRTAEILALVHAGDEETRRLMRVLHEAVIARIDTISRG
jgi:hypothetical protein